MDRSVVNKNVDAIVLAGSYQWTCSPFDELRVRPLLPVAQKALIDHVLGWLTDGGLGQAVICGNGSTPALRAHLLGPARSALDVRFYEDGTPRGAAGCVKDAAALSQSDTLVVTDSTLIPVCALDDLLAHHRRTGAALTVVVHQRVSRSGASVMQPAGMYVFDRKILDLIPPTSFQDIKENLIPKLYREGAHLEMFRVEQTSPRVLNASTYLAVNHWMISRLAASQTAGSSASRHTETIAHPSAWISPDAAIVGPVMLGPGVRVHAGATVIGPSSLGAGTVVEAGAVVARSVTWSGCSIGERAVVDQCVLADGSVAAPGSALGNAVRLQQPTESRFARALAFRRPSKTNLTKVVGAPAWS